MAAIECTEGRYEVQDVGLARIFKWCPEIALVECDCGELTTLDHSETTCAWCGADHASLVREELSAHRVVYETVRPWLRTELTAPVNLASVEYSLPSLSP
jgi:hypothetical protein